MSKIIFLKSFKIMVFFLLIISIGCAGSYKDRFYVPKQIPIQPGMILKPGFEICKEVTIINTQTNKIKYTGYYTHKWTANLQWWTETAMGVLKTELEKRGVLVTVGVNEEQTSGLFTSLFGRKQVIDDNKKILKLSITYADLFWKFKNTGCTLNLNVETGDGYTASFEKTDVSTDIYDSCDSAVTKAVAALFNDDKILGYLARPLSSKDTDCDGVSDDRDKCPGTPKGVKVDMEGCPLDTDGDGVPDYLDKCPGTPKDIEVDTRGCPLDMDKDGVPDYLDRCRETPKGVKVDNRGCTVTLDSDGNGVSDKNDKCPKTPKGAKVDKRGCWVIDNVLFDFNKYDIKPQYYDIIEEVAFVLRKNPGLDIEIHGYADIIGTEAFNQELSDKRAEVVMESLMRRGIRRQRLSTVGYGYSHPVASNETEAGRALNRRVHFVPVY